MQIQISLEGSNAIAFAEALKTLPSYEVTYEVGDAAEVLRGEQRTKLERVLITLTAVAQLANTSGQAAEQAVKVAEQIRDFKSPPIESVLIVPESGEQVTLKNATPEQVLEILAELDQ